MMTRTRALALITLMSATFGCSTTFNLMFTSDTAGGETDSTSVDPASSSTGSTGSTGSTSSVMPTTAAPPEPECGNGVLEAGEDCDDGNSVDGDGCTAACVVQVCGDGLVQDGEACDDGNQDDADCCTNVCTHGQAEPGQVCWTLSSVGEKEAAYGVAVDKTGRIIVVGFQSGDQLILVLDPGGKEVWRKTYAGQADLYDALYRVEVDDQGQIFAVGEETVNGIHTAVVVRSVAPDGELTWSFVEPNPIPDGASIDGVALASDGAIYSVGKEQHLQEGGELVLRRHDPVDGTPLWRSSTAAGMFEARGWGVALSGSNIVAVGSAREGGGGPENPLIAVYDPMGNEVSIDVEDHPYGAWLDVRPIGDAGDLLLAGQRVGAGTEVDLAFRRIDVTGAEKWTQLYDQDGLADPGSDYRDSALGAAVGPDEAIAIAGVSVTTNLERNAFTRRCTGDGAEVWTSLDTSPPDLFATATAFGPGFVVAVGYEFGKMWNSWIRAYKHK